MDELTLCKNFLDNPHYDPINPVKKLKRGTQIHNAYIAICRELGFNNEIDDMFGYNIYSKLVNEKEFLLTMIASEENISPKLISWENYEGEFLIHLEKYPKTLMDEPIWGIYKNKCIKLVEKLHSLEIFHSDIKEDNIVVDPFTKEVKLIDFGRSCWIKDITAYQLENNFYEVALNVGDLLELEIKEIEWLFNQRK